MHCATHREGAGGPLSVPAMAWGPGALASSRLPGRWYAKAARPDADAAAAGASADSITAGERGRGHVRTLVRLSTHRERGPALMRPAYGDMAAADPAAGRGAGRAGAVQGGATGSDDGGSAILRCTGCGFWGRAGLGAAPPTDWAAVEMARRAAGARRKAPTL